MSNRSFSSYLFIFLLTLLCSTGTAASVSIIGQSLPAELQKVLTEELDWSPGAAASVLLTDYYQSSTSQLHHYYFQMTIDGYPLLGAIYSVHLTATGDLFFHNAPSPDNLAQLSWPNLPQPDVSLWLANWQRQHAPHSNLKIVQEPKACWFSADQPRPAYETLIYADGDFWQLVHAFPEEELLFSQLLTKYCSPAGCAQDESSAHHHETSGLTSSSPPLSEIVNAAMPILFPGKYHYFPPYAPSPIYGDRITAIADDLIDPIAAPYGWHDIDGNASTIEYNYTRGNYVYARYSPDDLDNPPPIALTYAPDGSYLTGNIPVPATPLDFDYQNDLEPTDPREALPDAITNLFVWNNLCHDILYRHGFDEGAGNFQAVNFNSPGGDGDEVDARAQSGNGVNNATFSTPADGTNPIMRMFLWDTNLSGNFRDAAFDNIIISHEYAHGLSIRLVGGPGNVTCLNNFEQGGEGWSDIIGLLLNLRDTDGDSQLEESVIGEGVRTVGNYVLGQGDSNTGVRAQYYSTDMDCGNAAYCNDLTYDQLDQLQVPHGVGTLWGTVLWDFTWALINEYGFEPDLQSGNTTAGNIRALRSIIQGMSLTACSPTFIDMRNALLAGYQSLYGAADDEALWTVFARRGLGFSALGGGQAAYDTPTAFLTKTVNNPKATIGEMLTYTITVDNNSGANLSQVRIVDDFDPILQINSISDGGTRIGNSIVWPPISMVNGASTSRQFTATIGGSNGATVYISEPVEGSSLAFVPAGQWAQDSGETNPSTGSTTAWWHPSLPLLSESSLLLNVDMSNGGDILSFWQWHDTEAGVDGGIIEIQQGAGFTNLRSRILEYDYNGYLYDELILPNGTPLPFSTLSGESAYTGYSGGWKHTVADLSGYSGTVTLRFRYAADESTDTGNCDGPGTACGGWYLDDFELLDRFFLLNEACVSSNQGFSSCGDVGEVGTLYLSGAVLPVSWLSFKASPLEKSILLNWETALEQQNAGFWLERQVEGEQTFKRLTWIAATEQSEVGSHHYYYEDLNVRPNVTYIYRLRQEDVDGKFAYSPLVSARLQQASHWQVYPNPGQSSLFLLNSSFSQGQEQWQLEVISTTGIVLHQQQLIANQRIDLPDLLSGLYLLRLRSEREEEILKWVKE